MLFHLDFLDFDFGCGGIDSAQHSVRMWFSRSTTISAGVSSDIWSWRHLSFISVAWLYAALSTLLHFVLYSTFLFGCLDGVVRTLVDGVPCIDFHIPYSFFVFFSGDEHIDGRFAYAVGSGEKSSSLIKAVSSRSLLYFNLLLLKFLSPVQTGMQ